MRRDPYQGQYLDTPRRQTAAFSLIEMLVVMGLLSVIVLGLMAMFNQTQRAFHVGMSQTDILEGGRLVSDMLGRELEQVTPTGLAGTNANSVNFYSGIVNSALIGTVSTPASYIPLYQMLPSAGVPYNSRTNVLDDLFFITRQNQTWTGIGYFVRTNSSLTAGWAPVGTLYRFETNNPVQQFVNDSTRGSFFHAYQNASGLSGSGISKIMDGVVHFRVRAFDVNGNWINPTNFAFPLLRGSSTNYWSNPNLFPNDSDYGFYSNGVPAYVEIELGVLEQQTLDKYKSIPVAWAQAAFLTNQASHVHLFRQRVPIRNVDFSAYQ